MDILSELLLSLLRAASFRQLMLTLAALGLVSLIWLACSLPGRKRWKILTALMSATGLVSLTLPWLRHTFTTWPTALLFPLFYCTALTVLLILAQAFRTLLLVPALVAAPLWRAPLRLLLSRGASACVLLGGLALGSVAFHNAVKVPDVREVRIPVRNLAPELEGFHIVQLTDLHLGTVFTAPWVEDVVARVNALDADVIVVSGDLGESAPKLIARALAPLEKLRARDGVFFTLGNHEIYQGRQAWQDYYRSGGRRLLCGDHVELRRGRAALALGGADMRFHDSKALTHIFDGTSPGATRVLVNHVLDRTDEAERLGVALQLSGHTHGGLLPGFKQLVANSNHGFVSGLYRVGNMNLYVSNGTGLWSFVAIRLFTPSEISSLRLVRED